MSIQEIKNLYSENYDDFFCDNRNLCVIAELDRYSVIAYISDNGKKEFGIKSDTVCFSLIQKLDKYYDNTNIVDYSVKIYECRSKKLYIVTDFQNNIFEITEYKINVKEMKKEYLEYHNSKLVS